MVATALEGSNKVEVPHNMATEDEYSNEEQSGADSVDRHTKQAKTIVEHLEKHAEDVGDETISQKCAHHGTVIPRIPVTVEGAAEEGVLMFTASTRLTFKNTSSLIPCQLNKALMTCGMTQSQLALTRLKQS